MKCLFYLFKILSISSTVYLIESIKSRTYSSPLSESYPNRSNSDIAFMKDMSDRLCIKYGLSIVETNRAETEKNYREKRMDNFNPVSYTHLTLPTSARV